MEKLSIIDEINKDKSKKYLQLDKTPYRNETYIAYTKAPRTYLRLSENGKEQYMGRYYPIFEGFINGKGSVIYITGKKGTGKTIMLSAIASDYHKLNPNNKIYYCCSTSKNEDENLKDLPFVEDFDLGLLNEFKILDDKVEQIDNESKDADIIFEYFSNALFMFDDLDSLSKQVEARVNRFRNLLLELGRKRSVSIATVSHYETNFNKSRLILREMDFYITFVDSNLPTNRVLNNYKKFNLSKLMPNETYLIFDFNKGYCITNKRAFII